MGALVIRQYARLYPKQFVSLVVVDCPHSMRGFGEGL